jgi:hypothetical protein
VVVHAPVLLNVGADPLDPGVVIAVAVGIDPPM